MTKEFPYARKMSTTQGTTLLENEAAEPLSSVTEPAVMFLVLTTHGSKLCQPTKTQDDQYPDHQAVRKKDEAKKNYRPKMSISTEK